MLRSGGCECGSVSYTLTMDQGPLLTYACHCLNCQVRSGSAFGKHAMVDGSAFICEGDTVSYRRGDGGQVFEEVFCSTCYTRLFNRNSALPGMIFLRAGTLSGDADLDPVAHIWTRRKQRWVALPVDVPSFEESPTPEQFGEVVRKAVERLHPSGE